MSSSDDERLLLGETDNDQVGTPTAEEEEHLLNPGEPYNVNINNNVANTIAPSELVNIALGSTSGGLFLFTTGRGGRVVGSILGGP